MVETKYDKLQIAPWLAVQIILFILAMDELTADHTL